VLFHCLLASIIGVKSSSVEVIAASLRQRAFFSSVYFNFFCPQVSAVSLFLGDNIALHT
jgi:hypothetical protein